MARTIRDSKLETRAARSRLKVQHKPYLRLIEPGLHLGYRRLASGPGTWQVRRYSGAGQYVTATLRTADGTLIVADDFADADGVQVLSFAQAQQLARGPQRRLAGPYTVANAMDDYLAWLEASGRPTADARIRDHAHIRPALGSIDLDRLTADRLRTWLVALAKAAPRLRTRKGEVQKHKAALDSDDYERRRQAAANRTLTVLKAALNRAWREGRAASDAAWRRVEPFHSVGAARIRYLTVAEAKRLVNACDPDFRRLVQAALATGGRYGQITALVAGDFNADAGTVAMTTLKGRGRARTHHVVLNQEGVEFFAQITVGLAPGDIVFRKDDGAPWGKSDQARPMREACKRAKIVPPVGFHGLRHTWASLAIMGGVPLVVVAENLGHADTRMVSQHYGHLAPSFKAEAIRAGAPVFGLKSDRKITALTGRR